ncbi:hypothetical protein [Rheinheimera sp. 1928-s]|uniref:hypothetical protein n=1 Tax=Rheinheimera sp. 1928-s TaxID=3033803 RepID=UPI002612E84A|nr:hypothetical protein [Rheinheimera sp. 1928-s]MDF3127413.1 hypothetical protein [Rheinheimera sp. 1928-s]
MTLKEAQALLRAWGKFWRSKEYGTGYGATSITYQMMQTGLLGQAGKSTKHLFSHLSDSLSVPNWVQEIDFVIKYLTIEEKKVIHSFYVKNVKPPQYSDVILQRLEIKLAALL